ncbi:MAG: hypothetical protein ACK4IT_05305 [Thioalkalivibrionaceae bacterium]
MNQPSDQNTEGPNAQDPRPNGLPLAFDTVAGILLLRAGPQDLPADPRLLIAWIIVSMIAALGYLDLGPGGVGLTLATNALDLAALYLVTLGLLAMRDLGSRLLQTFTSLVASSSVLAAALVPIFLIWEPFPDAETVAIVPLLAMLFMLGWVLIVFGHIYRESLGLRGHASGFMLALAVVLVTAIVSQVAVGLALGLGQSTESAALRLETQPVFFTGDPA